MPLCERVNQDDKTRILATVTSFPGGVAEFNRHVMAIALSDFGEARGLSKPVLIAALREWPVAL